MFGRTIEYITDRNGSLGRQAERVATDPPPTDGT
jgi:hypothetical protein